MDEIVCHGNVLFEGSKVIIPSTMYEDVLRAIDHCHLGADTCLNRAKEVLFWPGTSALVKAFISQCSICNQFLSKQRNKNRRLLKLTRERYIYCLIFLLIQVVDV